MEPVVENEVPSDEQLLAAWSVHAEPPGAIVDSSKAWFLNQIDGAKAELKSEPSQMIDALPDAVVQVQKQTGTDWHIQLIHPDIDLEDGRTYSVLFECRSHQPGTLRISCDRDRDDYRKCGLSESLQTSSDWTQHAFTFTATSPEPKHSRLVFHLGQLHDIELRDIRMFRGHSKPVVAPEHSFTKGNLPIAPTSHAIPNRDWIDFLAALDRSYSDDFRKFFA